MRRIKKDKLGRIHLSGIHFEEPVDGNRLFEIAKNSTFPIILGAYQNNDIKYFGNGTAFIYK